MTETKKQEFIKEVVNLVEGRLSINIYTKTKLKEMGFSEEKIDNKSADKILTGQIKYGFQGFDIAIGVSSRKTKKFIMAIKFD